MQMGSMEPENEVEFWMRNFISKLYIFVCSKNGIHSLGVVCLASNAKTY